MGLLRRFLDTFITGLLVVGFIVLGTFGAITVLFLAVASVVTFFDDSFVHPERVRMLGAVAWFMIIIFAGSMVPPEEP